MKNFNLFNRVNDTKRWIAAFTLIAILFVGVIASLVMNIYNITSKNNAVAEETQQESEKSHLLAGEFTGNGLTLSLASDASSDNPDGVTITATLDAEFNGYDDGLVWTIAYKNPDSDWAKSFPIEEVLKMNISQDTHTVTVSDLRDFAEPIIVTATSVDNANCSATCQLDYVAKIFCSYGLGINCEYYYQSEYNGYLRFDMTNTADLKFTLSEGTISPIATIENIEITISEEMQNLINDNITGATAKEKLVMQVEPTYSSEFNPGTDCQLTGAFNFNVSDLINESCDTRQLNNALYKNAHLVPSTEGAEFMNATATINVSVSYNGTVYQNYSFTMPYSLKFERGKLELIPAVTDIILDKENIIF